MSRFGSETKLAPVPPLRGPEFFLPFAPVRMSELRAEQPLDPIALPNGSIFSKVVACNWQNQQLDTTTDLSASWGHVRRGLKLVACTSKLRANLRKTHTADGPRHVLIRNNRTSAQENGAIESWRGLSEENNLLLPTAFLKVVEGPPGLSAVV